MSQAGVTERSVESHPIAGSIERDQPRAPADSAAFALFKSGLESLAVAIVYIAVAKLGLGLASVNPSATPVWPPTGYALAMVLLLGYRVAPAIFIAAVITNATTAGSLYTWLGIATGNTLECVVGAYLINRFSQGRKTFDTPSGVAKFALICFVPTTLISAAIGTGALNATAYAAWSDLPAIGMTWWMGDLAGALVITPAIMLWAHRPAEASDASQSILVHIAAVVVGLIAFSPLLEQTTARTPVAFLAILPLMWAALRCGQRDTASAALVLSGFAVWGTIAGNGPFAQSTQNDSFLLLLAFMISVSVPSLALSADVAARKRNETHVTFIMRELSHRSKNLLAVVQGIANQIGRRTDTFESFRLAFATRLQAIAQTHDLLVQANWEGAQICDLVQLHLAPFQNAAEALIVEGPQLRLSAKAAEQIGLAFYELATNAAKYGALSLPTGVVEIRWELEIDDTGTKRLHVTWQEVGGPKVHEARRRGFGSIVLTKLVPMSLGGTASLTFDHDGAKWLFSTPANSVLR